MPLSARARDIFPTKCRWARRSSRSGNGAGFRADKRIGQSMPASVISIRGRREGAWVALEAALPGRAACNIGVLLIEPESDRGWLRMRPDFAEIAAPEDAEVLEAMEEHIRQCLAEQGAQAFLASL